jgi:hypothetical protein
MKTTLKHLLLLLLALPTLVCAAPPTLTTQGYGAVHFGMPIAAAEKAMAQRTRQRIHNKDCQYVEFRKYPGIRFMVEAGIVMRADTDKNLRNSLGARMGMDMETFKARHPELELKALGSGEDGLTYEIKAPEKDAALVLFAEDGKLRYMWAGIAPAYTYYEGCM